jgi:hypothetical protein
MLAMMNPMQRIVTVVRATADAKPATCGWSGHWVVAPPRESHEQQREPREEELRQHVRPEDGRRPERRGSKALENAPLAVDRDDRDERERSVDRDEDRDEEGEVLRQELCPRCRVTGVRTQGAAEQEEHGERDPDRRDEPERLAHEDPDLEPGELEESAHG